MEWLSIGEVARQAGIQPSAIRFYEQIGLLPKPSRVNGRRRYDATVLQNLRIIHMTQGAACAAENHRDRGAHHAAHPMQSFLVNALDCRCASLDECATLAGSTA